MEKEKNQLNLTWGWRDVAAVVFIMAVIYVLIGVTSLIAVALGADMPYMPFWHAPWRWLAQLLGLI
jgi:hypothetical protein